MQLIISPRNITYSDDLRSQLYEGVRKLNDAVKVTMGPRGRNVLIESDDGTPPHITKDGVTVAKSIELENQYENMGAHLVKMVSMVTAEDAGDGTTTATVLAHSIFKEGLRNVTAGANPIELKRGMDKAVECILENLKAMSIPVETKQQIKQVATISSNSDHSIGDIIAEAMDAVGKEGIITVENAKGLEDELEVVKGMRNGHGMLSPYFATDSEKGECVFENPYILLYEGRLNNLNDLVGVLEAVQKQNRPLIIVSDEIDNDVLNTLVVNKLRGALQVCAIRSYGVGADRQDQHIDYGILTGGKPISINRGEKLSSVTINDLGTCAKAIITLKTSTIVNGGGEPDKIDARINEIKKAIKEADPMNKRGIEQLEQRLARLSGGVAIIRMGAPSETELKERKDRMDDAMAATKAAVAEGIVIGGGCAILKAAANINVDLDGDQRIGADIVLRAIQAPIKQIAENAGYDSGVVTHMVLSHENPNYGFDAGNGEMVDMFDAGIIDPLKVERVALQQAVSVSSLLLTSEAGIIAANPEYK